MNLASQGPSGPDMTPDASFLSPVAVSENVRATLYEIERAAAPLMEVSAITGTTSRPFVVSKWREMHVFDVLQWSWAAASCENLFREEAYAHQTLRGQQRSKGGACC